MASMGGRGGGGGGGRGGGRGGFGGGRGGFRGGSGLNPNWGNDIEMKPEFFKPTDLYPVREMRHAQPVQRPLTKEEKMDVRLFLDHRQKVHDGPLYTVLGKRKSLDDPFDAVPTYSKRYRKVRRKVPKLDARPYVFKLFPEELYSTMDPTYKATGADAAAARARKKRLLITALDPNSLQHDGALSTDEGSASEAEGGKNSKKREGLLSALLANEDDEDDGGDDDLEDDEEDKEDEDDEFEDDEDNDYNAEQYFDDGDNDGDYGDHDDGGDYL